MGGYIVKRYYLAILTSVAILCLQPICASEVDGTDLGTFVVTAYNIANEADHPCEDTDKILAKGLDYYYCPEFLSDIIMQGSGVDNNKEFIQIDWSGGKKPATASDTFFTYVPYITAGSGQRLEDGISIAVDPSVIPLNSWVYIESIGWRRADDTGGAIKGKRIDVFMNVPRKDAINFGKKSLNVVLQSGTSEAIQKEPDSTKTSDSVTLTLYVHDETVNGPVTLNAQVTGQDASGKIFQQTTDRNGYLTITGDPGTWSFSVSADGYKTNSWSQPITETDTKDAFLQKSLGGINFTSISLNYLSMSEDNFGDINFDYVFKAQKQGGANSEINFNESSEIGLNAFMTGLAIPNNRFWVNLDPNEPDRIIDDLLSESEVGRIMLEADLQMKRDFAKYNCAHEADNASMDRLLAEKKNSLVQKCMDRFPGEIKDMTNVHFRHTIRYWIVPDKIYAYINGSEIYIINATLTINSVVEEKHFSISGQDSSMISDSCRDELNRSVEEYSEYDREIEESAITPNVIEDINYGAKYESLREVYVALALAQWYKSNLARADILRNSLESSKSIESIAITPWTPTEIWGRYMDSIKNNDERCSWWFNTTTKTTTGTINKTILRSRGGVGFENIIDQIITIDEMPSELQNQVKMAITSGVIDEEDYVLFGNRLHLDSIQNASIAGVFPLSNVTQPDPELARVWFNKGRDLDDLGEYDEAIEAYDEAIRLNPNYAKAWFNKGLSLDDLGKYDEAVKAYDEAIRLDPNNAAMAWNNKGISLDDLGKYDEAIEAYDEAIKLDPNYATAWNNKGIALRKLDRTEEAEAAFAKAKELGYSR